MKEKKIFTTQYILRRKKRIVDINRCFKRINHIPQNILDVGFGNGGVVEYYSSKGFEVGGIEIDQKKIDSILERIPNGNFLLYDGENIPFEDSTFDTILMNDILEHISYEDIELLFPEIFRVLKPKGIIYISVMNRWQLLEPHKLIPFLTWLPTLFWHPLCRKLRNQDYIFYWPYTRKRLESLYKRHNLKFQDLSDIYVSNKFMGINPVGSRTTARLISVMKQLRLTRFAYILALKVTVLVYLSWNAECRKIEESK